MAHPKHEDVRQRFQERCGYCGVSEQNVGAELTVDHFRPVSAQGDDHDDNLVYACFRCNLFKRDFFPSPDDETQIHRVLHPLHDNLATHFRENPLTGILEALTETGRFHIFLLRLNRPQLVAHRLQVHLTLKLQEAHQLLSQENQILHAQIAAMEAYLQQLRLVLPVESERDDVPE
jgi:hypothetical protein